MKSIFWLENKSITNNYPMKTRSKRWLIREALINRLKEISALDSRVWDGLLHPLTTEQLPAVTVQLEHDRIIDEWSSWISPGVSLQMHECLFLIRVFSKVEENGLSETLESLMNQIINAFNQKQFLGTFVKTIQLELLEGMTIEQGEIPVGSTALSCKVYYAKTGV